MYGIIEPEENLPKIRNKKSALYKAFTKEIYSKLYYAKTSTGYTIDEAIQIGIDCDDHEIGFLLGDYECIEVFEPLLGRILIECQPNFDYNDLSINHVGSLGGLKFHGTETLKDFVVEFAFHLRRNLRGYSLPPQCTRAERREINRILIYILKQLQFDNTFPNLKESNSKKKKFAQNKKNVKKFKNDNKNNNQMDNNDNNNNNNNNDNDDDKKDDQAQNSAKKKKKKNKNKKAKNNKPNKPKQKPKQNKSKTTKPDKTDKSDKSDKTDKSDKPSAAIPNGYHQNATATVNANANDDINNNINTDANDNDNNNDINDDIKDNKGTDNDNMNTNDDDNKDNNNKLNNVNDNSDNPNDNDDNNNDISDNNVDNDIVDVDDDTKSQIVDLVNIDNATLTELEERGLAPSREAALSSEYLIGGLSRDFPDARTLFYNIDAMVGAWTNHENHFEMIIQHTYADLNYVYKKFCDIYLQFRYILKRKEMAWIRHRRLGIITTSPKHFGTGLTVRCSIRAPYLIKHDKFIYILTKRHLELVNQSDDIVDLETVHTLGRTELLITSDLGNALVDLCRMEKLLSKNKKISQLI